MYNNIQVQAFGLNPNIFGLIFSNIDPILAHSESQTLPMST